MVSSRNTSSHQSPAGGLCPGRGWLFWILTLSLAGEPACTPAPTSSLPGKVAGDSNTAAAAGAGSQPQSFGFGRRASAADIARLDIDVRPDGRGLPAGSGTVAAGKALYAGQCAACHGIAGTEGPASPLVAAGPLPEKGGSRNLKAIGNYWPYATTLFDYIRRAMPFNAPGSLTDTEVYSLTAYLLAANRIIAPEAVINARTLPQVVMPAQKLFVPDDRQGGQQIR